jgi:hypothetical protein
VETEQTTVYNIGISYRATREIMKSYFFINENGVYNLPSLILISKSSYINPYFSI